MSATDGPLESRLLNPAGNLIVLNIPVNSFQDECSQLRIHTTNISRQGYEDHRIFSSYGMLSWEMT